MRIDRLLRAGPFKEGLISTVTEMLAKNPGPGKALNKEHFSLADSAWQKATGSAGMKEEALSQEARVLFTLLLTTGAPSKQAATFVRSLQSDYAFLTFSPVKLNRLLSANPFLIREVEGSSLVDYVRSASSVLNESSSTALIYLEIACRSLMLSNHDIIGKFHDEVELGQRVDNPHFNLPMKSTVLSSSRFLVMSNIGSDDGLMVEHCDNSHALSGIIARDPALIEGIIQDITPSLPFKTQRARRMWIYKQILMMQLGSSKAFWLRRGGLLQKLLDLTILKEPTTFKKVADFTGFYSVLASPVRSTIPEADWMRVATTSRLTKLGASMVEGEWEFELVSVNGIAELPSISHSFKWLISERDLHSGESLHQGTFLTLGYDSESVRRIRLHEVDLNCTEATIEVVPTTATAGAARKEKENKEAAPQGQQPTQINGLTQPLGGAITPVLSNAEVLSLAEVENRINSADQEIREAISAALRAGIKSEAQSIEDYITSVYANAGVQSLIEKAIPEWSVKLNDTQRALVVKQMRILIATMYATTTQQGGLNG